jgi:hypothetical protein
VQRKKLQTRRQWQHSCRRLLIHVVELLQRCNAAPRSGAAAAPLHALLQQRCSTRCCNSAAPRAAATAPLHGPQLQQHRSRVRSCSSAAPRSVAAAVRLHAAELL